MGGKRLVGPRRPGGKFYKKRPSKVLSKPAKTQVKAIVKRAIAAENETKFVSTEVANDVSYNSQITTVADMLPCLPKIVQDEGKGAAYERLGTKVTPKSVNVHIHASLTQQLERSTAIKVFWYILESKRYKNLKDSLALANIPALLRTGDGGEVSTFTGVPVIASLPVNDTEFRVLKRGTFVLQKNTGLTQDNTTAGNQPLVNPICKSWSVKLKTPKRFIYDQDEDSPRLVYYPNNFAPFLVIGYVHQDHSTPDITNQDVSVSVRASMYYDDA